MDLYIRSKDKMQIEKMRRIAYEPHEEFDFSSGKSKALDHGDIWVNGRAFGDYTKDQAKDILDTVQKVLTPALIFPASIPTEYNDLCGPDEKTTAYLIAKKKATLIDQGSIAFIALPDFDDADKK